MFRTVTTLIAIRPQLVHIRQHFGNCRIQGFRNFIAQLGLSESAHMKGVPLALDLIQKSDERQIFELLGIPQEFGRPYFGPPGVPADADVRHQDRLLDVTEAVHPDVRAEDAADHATARDNAPRGNRGVEGLAASSGVATAALIAGAAACAIEVKEAPPAATATARMTACTEFLVMVFVP